MKSCDSRITFELLKLLKSDDYLGNVFTDSPAMTPAVFACMTVFSIIDRYFGFICILQACMQ